MMQMDGKLDKRKLVNRIHETKRGLKLADVKDPAANLAIETTARYAENLLKEIEAGDFDV